MEMCKVVEGKSGRFFKGCPWIWKQLKAGNTEGVKIHLEGVQGLSEELLSEKLLELWRECKKAGVPVEAVTAPAPNNIPEEEVAPSETVSEEQPKRVRLGNGETKLNKYGFIHIPRKVLASLPFTVDQPLKLEVADGVLEIRAA